MHGVGKVLLLQRDLESPVPFTNAAHSVGKSYRRQNSSAWALCPAVSSIVTSSLVACGPTLGPHGPTVDARSTPRQRVAVLSWLGHYGLPRQRTAVWERSVILKDSAMAAPNR